MKKILVILLALASSTVSYAETVTDKSEKTKSEKENKEYNPEELKGHSDPSLEVVKPEQKVESKSQEVNNDPDSSYYSVNKFNYLFYYVYKIKYLSEDDPEMIMGVEP
ncbi:hypothetical protein [Reichenbachiella ulvae]|uniref:Uncharacterized protein n=1 Tax=Reichenbachiella ulvae TaxID=2980104 RepID=A0ABT3CZ43_9BACT|nr:hypothetical protein [Reichenbachiella ulvae]MCV9388789.1 hypothetical protein [Reichenbachiella ulvae]